VVEFLLIFAAVMDLVLDVFRYHGCGDDLAVCMRDAGPGSRTEVVENQDIFQSRVGFI